MSNVEAGLRAAHSIELLMREIEQYLAAVDEFRRLGCEPRWRPEEVQR